MAEKKKNTVAVVTELAQPVADAQNVTLWDVRYEKEGDSWYLRIFLDKEGGVTINDCEAVSRKLSDLLDEADPIPQSYILEVSSPGVERDLVKPWHFARFIGSMITVRLIRPVEGVRDFAGRLTAFEDGQLTLLLEDDLEMTVTLKETAFVRLQDDFDMNGLQDD